MSRRLGNDGDSPTFIQPAALTLNTGAVLAPSTLGPYDYPPEGRNEVRIEFESQVGALTFEIKLVAGCEPVEFEHEISGPEVAEIVQLLRPMNGFYTNLLKQLSQEGILVYRGRLESVSWARLKYSKPAYVADFPGGKYVLDGDGTLRFEVLLKEYGKLPEAIGMA